MNSVVSYTVLSGEVQMDVDGVLIDHIPAPLDAYVSSEQRTVALQALISTNENWQEVRLKVSVSVNPAEIDAGPWTDLVVVAVASNSRANVAAASRLSSTGPGRWAGEVELSRDAHVGHTKLTARVAATVEGYSGRLIGTAPDWDVRLDSKAPTSELTLPMKWVDFSEDQGLKEYQDDPWLLVFDGGEPTLHLNSGFEGLREVWERKGSPEQNTLGEVLASQVTQEVWTSLFNSALQAASLEEDEEEVEWPGGWYDTVLHAFLPGMYPDTLPELKLAELIRERTSSSGGADLQMRLGHEAARHARRTRKLSTGLRDLAKAKTKKEHS